MECMNAKRCGYVAEREAYILRDALMLVQECGERLVSGVWEAASQPGQAPGLSGCTTETYCKYVQDSPEMTSFFQSTDSLGVDRGSHGGARRVNLFHWKYFSWNTG